MVFDRGGVRDTDRPSLPETDVACAGERDWNLEVNSPPLREVGRPTPLRVSRKADVDGNTQAEATRVFSQPSAEIDR